MRSRRTKYAAALSHCVIHAQPPPILPPRPPGAERRKYPINRESNSPDTPRNPINFPSPALFPAISTVFTTAARSRTVFPSDKSRAFDRSILFSTLGPREISTPGSNLPGFFFHSRNYSTGLRPTLSPDIFARILNSLAILFLFFFFFFFFFFQPTSFAIFEVDAPRRNSPAASCQSKLFKAKFFKIPAGTLRRESIFFQRPAGGMLCPHFPPLPSRQDSANFPLNSSTAKRFRKFSILSASRRFARCSSASISIDLARLVN